MGTMKLSLALGGEKVVIAGLALQVAIFILFLAATIDFHIRMSRTTLASPATGASKSWMSMLNLLYTLSVLILFRCVFRLIEYAMGNAAYLIVHEWTLYTFDAVPMFAVLVLLLMFQPRELVKSEERKVDESSDGEMGVVKSR